jgi:hypothetical protein
LILSDYAKLELVVVEPSGLFKSLVQRRKRREGATVGLGFFGRFRFDTLNEYASIRRRGKAEDTKKTVRQGCRRGVSFDRLCSSLRISEELLCSLRECLRKTSVTSLVQNTQQKTATVSRDGL